MLEQEPMHKQLMNDLGDQVYSSHSKYPTKSKIESKNSQTYSNISSTKPKPYRVEKETSNRDKISGSSANVLTYSNHQSRVPVFQSQLNTASDIQYSPTHHQTYAHYNHQPFIPTQVPHMHHDPSFPHLPTQHPIHSYSPAPQHTPSPMHASPRAYNIYSPNYSQSRTFAPQQYAPFIPPQQGIPPSRVAPPPQMSSQVFFPPASPLGASYPPPPTNYSEPGTPSISRTN